MPVVFTGHSLGGAVASMLSLFAIAPTAKRAAPLPPSADVHLYTFGQPRSGDYLFAQSVDRFVASAYRIVHNRDEVPLIPACVTFFPGGACQPHGPFGLATFYHHGTQIW